jgi:tetratricopeptide (TPR) repeat protein
MVLTGRRFWYLMAGYAASACAVLSVPAEAGNMPVPMTVASVAQMNPSASQPVFSEISAQAMDFMRAGRAGDALAVLEPVSSQLAALTKAKAGRVTCQQGQRGKQLLDADLCQALYLRAFAFTELGRRADAVEALEQLTVLSPEYPRYFVELAYAYRVGGDKVKALATYQHAASLAEKPALREENKRYHAAALRGVGYLLIEQGDLAGAEAAYRASLADDPDSKIAIKELSFIARKRADGEQKGG